MAVESDTTTEIRAASAVREKEREKVIIVRRRANDCDAKKGTEHTTVEPAK
jgi:hypothetical protein